MSQRTASRSTRIAVCSAGAAALAIAACTFGVPAKTAQTTGGTVMLQLTPAGTFKPNDGRELKPGAWRIDAASAQHVIERFKTRGKPPVIDYEHQTLKKEQNGQPAPAAGWIRDLRWVEGQGLYAVAELTARARDYIKAGEYLYFSPVFEYDEITGTVLAVHMGALTNDPGISGMEPLSLVAAATAAFLPSTTPRQEPSVNPLLKALLAALGLPETTTEPAAIAALSALGPLQPLQARANVATAVCTALKLPADATPEVATAACASLAQAQPGTPDPAKFVPIEAVQQLQTQVAALTATQQAGQVDALIQPALADGRLLPALETWARDLGKKDMAALTAYLGAAKPIAALAGTQTGGKAPTATGDQQLSAEELAVCSAMGMAPDAYRKAGTAVATGAATAA